MYGSDILPSSRTPAITVAAAGVSEKPVSSILWAPQTFFFHNWENKFVIKTSYATLSSISREGLAQRKSLTDIPYINISEKGLLLTASDVDIAKEVIYKRTIAKYPAPIHCDYLDVAGVYQVPGSTLFTVARGGDQNPLLNTRLYTGQIVAIVSAPTGSRSETVFYSKVNNYDPSASTISIGDGFPSVFLGEFPKKVSEMYIGFSQFLSTAAYYFKGDYAFGVALGGTLTYPTVNGLTPTCNQSDTEGTLNDVDITPNTNLGGVTVAVDDLLMITFYKQARNNTTVSFTAITGQTNNLLPLPYIKLRGVQKALNTAVSYEFTPIINWNEFGSVTAPYGGQGGAPTTGQLLTTSVAVYYIRITQAMINSHGNTITLDFGLQSSATVNNCGSVELEVYRNINWDNPISNASGMFTSQTRQRTYTQFQANITHTVIPEQTTAEVCANVSNVLPAACGTAIDKVITSAKLQLSGTAAAYPDSLLGSLLSAPVKFGSYTDTYTIATPEYPSDSIITTVTSATTNRCGAKSVNNNNTFNVDVAGSSFFSRAYSHTYVTRINPSRKDIAQTTTINSQRCNFLNQTGTYSTDIASVRFNFSLRIIFSIKLEGANTNLRIYPCIECDPISESSLNLITATISETSFEGSQSIGVTALDNPINRPAPFNTFPSNFPLLPSAMNGALDSFILVPLISSKNVTRKYEDTPETTSRIIKSATRQGLGRSIEEYPKIKSGYKYKMNLEFFNRDSAFQFIKVWNSRYGRGLPLWVTDQGTKLNVSKTTNGLLVSYENLDQNQTQLIENTVGYMAIYAEKLIDVGTGTQTLFLAKGTYSKYSDTVRRFTYDFAFDSQGLDSTTTLVQSSTIFSAEPCYFGYFANDELEEIWSSNMHMECEIEIEEDRQFVITNPINTPSIAVGCGNCNDQLNNEDMCRFILNGVYVGFDGGCCGCLSMSNTISVTLQCFGKCKATSVDGNPENYCVASLGDACRSNGSATFTLRMDPTEFSDLKDKINALPANNAACSDLVITFYGGRMAYCGGSTTNDPTPSIAVDYHIATGQMWIRKLMPDESCCYSGCGCYCANDGGLDDCTQACNNFGCQEVSIVEPCLWDAKIPAGSYGIISDASYYYPSSCSSVSWVNILCCRKCHLCTEDPEPCFRSSCKAKTKLTMSMNRGTSSTTVLQASYRCGHSRGGCTTPVTPVSVGLVPKRNGIVYGVPWSYEGNNTNGEAWAAP